jgi:hypothetical protein
MSKLFGSSLALSETRFSYVPEKDTKCIPVRQNHTSRSSFYGVGFLKLNFDRRGASWDYLPYETPESAVKFGPVEQAWKPKLKYRLSIELIKTCDILMGKYLLYNPSSSTNQKMADEMQKNGAIVDPIDLNNGYRIVTVPLFALKQLRELSFKRAQLLALRMDSVDPEFR